MHSASMVPFASGLYPNTLEKLPSPSNSTSCSTEVRCSETHADRMILSLTASSQACLNLLTFSHCISRYVEHMQNDVALGFFTSGGCKPETRKSSEAFAASRSTCRQHKEQLKPQCCRPSCGWFSSHPLDEENACRMPWPAVPKSGRRHFRLLKAARTTRLCAQRAFLLYVCEYPKNRDRTCCDMQLRVTEGGWAAVAAA